MKTYKTAPKQIPKIDNFEKFLSKIKINTKNQCWEWVGGIYPNTGYGYFTEKRKQYRAHRISYSIFKGDLDLLKVIDHICRNRKCVNPEHLREASCKENCLENSMSIFAKNKTKTHCMYGHELVESNLIINKKNGKRNCRICQRAHSHLFSKNLPLIELAKFFNYERKNTHCVNGHDVTNAPKRSTGIGFYCKECASLNRYKRIERQKESICQ